MTIEPATDESLTSSIGRRIADAWPGSTFVNDPTPLVGGFWASMYRLRVEGQPMGVPADLVFRIAPDATMSAKEVAVQQTVRELGFPTPAVRLSRPDDAQLGGSWSVMDFAAGSPPLGDLNGFAALRRGVSLFGRLPKQLATPLADLHALDPAPVTAAVAQAAPAVAWRVEDLLGQFETGAAALGRRDLIEAAQKLADRRPPESDAVLCHGDFHPFNLLVDNDDVTVLDWTGALLAEPAFDVAYTAMLLANPPLDAPRPLAPIITRLGAALARRFVTHYQSLSPRSDLTALGWYRALHGLRMLIEIGSATPGESASASHPFEAMKPAATAALTSATGASLAG